ncbi:MAG TPA: PEP-CTERM sorting domain-containing protein, partial [Chthoniobacterales bacterium]|nr:PEP-CTERM sorting domain-containing protein [Chthoniobacterales bacterium]
AEGPGSHSLIQNFVVPSSPVLASLQFDLYINNHATNFFSPASLDFSTPTLNQQFRVDIMTGAADPFSLSLTDVLLNIYQTQPADSLVSGYNTITSDLTALFAAHPGETLKLRFAAVDNVNFLNIGIDRVSLAVPEPGSTALLAIGLATLATTLVRRRNNKS